MQKSLSRPGSDRWVTTEIYSTLYNMKCVNLYNAVHGFTFGLVPLAGTTFCLDDIGERRELFLALTILRVA